VRIHLAGKHPLKFELFDFAAQPVDVRLDGGGRAVIRVGGSEIEKFGGIGQCGRETVQSPDDQFELRTLLAEGLGPLRIIPNTRLLELALYFLQTLALIVVIKDTSAKSPCARRDL
jgi:hypothetical protein